VAFSIQNVLYRNSVARHPKARLKVLEAAERVVRERGAAALTFEEVSAASGVTRGGITYHFPTKDELLRALVERDRDRWAQDIAAARPGAERCSGGCPLTTDLVAYIRSSTRDDPEHRRYVSGMLGAVAHDPQLLEGCRDFYRAQIAAERWTDPHLRRLVLQLAADGLFWMETLGFVDLPANARRRLVALLEALAVAWVPPAEGSAAKRRAASHRKAAPRGKGKSP
jgi:AcrR family transcriptional regulator